MMGDWIRDGERGRQIETHVDPGLVHPRDASNVPARARARAHARLTSRVPGERARNARLPNFRAAEDNDERR